jgi:chromosome partitioning protein
MPVIALVGNKGGTGKTTLCVNLASALAGSYRVVILDADPQRSALQWRDISDRDDVVPVRDSVGNLGKVVAEAAADHQFTLIDCPPSVRAPQTREALAISDLALIPVQPSPLDLWATVHIEQEIESARVGNPGLRAVLVINQMEPRTRLSRLVRLGLAELNLPVAETAIHRRVAYRSSILEGRTVLDQGRRGESAADEIRKLIEEVVIQ